MKVSVIIPVFNGEKHLKECLDSIISQSLRDIQIICVNDGSTDNSIDILQYYKSIDKRVQVVHKPNGGLSSARNAGIEKAKGEYLSFIDCDDLVDESFLESLYNKCIIDDSDMGMAPCHYFREEIGDMEERCWINDLIEKLEGDIVKEPSKRRIIIETSTVTNKLFKTAFINKFSFRFFEGLFWEDNPFTIQSTILANRISIVQSSAYRYRQHDGSIIAAARLDRKPFDIFEIMGRLDSFFLSNQEHIGTYYNGLFEDLKFIFYTVFYFEKVNSTYKAEFYKIMRSEFISMEPEQRRNLSKKYPLFNQIILMNHFFFILFQRAIRILK